LNASGNGVVQAAMADFISAGHFGAHIRRMREIYQERRDALCAAVEQYAAERITLGPSDAGMHAVGWLPPRTDVSTLRRHAAADSVHLRDLRPYYHGRPPGPGVVLNFASSPPPDIRRGVRAIARWI